MKSEDRNQEADRTVLLGEEAGRTVLLEEESEKTVLLEEDKTDHGRQESEYREIPAGETRDWAANAQKRCPNCMKELKPGAKFCPKCGFKIGTKPKEIYHLHPGMALAGRYMIGTVLGFGGFGITYRAWDNKLNVMVAIKEYYPAGIVNRIPGEMEVILYTGKSRKEFAAGLERFLEEARNTVRFSDHPNIVNVFDFFEENGTAYIVMEFLDGISLKDYMKKAGGKLGYEEAVTITCAIMEALKQVHGAGILHRDISPDNIFLCSDGRIKLIDFGAARFSTGEEEKTLSIVLKMGYAPPEQYRSKSRQGPWTDVYALGATLYRIVTGKVPDESVNRVVEDTVEEPCKLEPSVPEYLSRAVMKAMALIPELRFQSIGEFQEAILNRTKVLALETDVKRRRLRRAAGIGAGAVILLAAAGISWTIYHNKRTEAFLAKADVSMWIPIREGRTEEEEKSIFEDMASEFEKDYPQVSFDVTYIPEEEYRTRMKEALDEGELPVLFESSGLEDGLNGAAEPLEDVLKRLDPDEYYFLDSYESYFPEADQIPLGFEVSVLYGNEKKLDDLSSVTDKNDADSFLGRKSAMYTGSTSEYHVVQDVLKGLYVMKAIPEEETVGRFNHLWSVSKSASRAEKLAAERLLYYYLSEKGQEVLHVNNRGSLPLGRNQMEVYLGINGEMDFLSQMIEDVKIIPAEEMEEACRELYQKLYGRKEAVVSYLKETAEER